MTTNRDLIVHTVSPLRGWACVGTGFHHLTVVAIEIAARRASKAGFMKVQGVFARFWLLHSGAERRYFNSPRRLPDEALAK